MRTAIALAIGLVASAACTPPAERLPGAQPREGEPVDEGVGIPPLPSVARCNDVPLGRTYLSVEGYARDADRLDQAIGAEHSIPVINTRWYTGEVEHAILSALGSYPHVELFQQPGIEGTFNGTRPAFSFARMNQGPLTAVKLFQLGFQVTLAEIDSRRGYSLWDDDKYQSPPTAENVRPFCETVMSGAWRRTPTSEEVASCVAYATEDVSDDPDPRRQWAYVGGSIVASPELWAK